MTVPASPHNIRNLLTTTGTLGATQPPAGPYGACTISAYGQGSGTIDVGGTWTGTLQFWMQTKQTQAIPAPPGGTPTTAAANFTALPCLPVVGGSFVTSTTTNGVWSFNVPAGEAVWVIATTISGTADVQINVSPAATASGLVLGAISGTVTTSGPSAVTGTATPLTSNGSVATLNISGAQFATARFVFTAPSGSQTLEFDYTIDGVNWIPSGQGAPYVRRLDVATANPSIVAGSTFTAGGTPASFDLNTYGASTWELALAGNVQAVRVKSLATGTATVIISGGLPYQLGVPVVATLFDMTSASNTAMTLNCMDAGGWSRATMFVNSGGTPSLNFQSTDDAGTVLANLVSTTTAGAQYTIGPGAITSQGGYGQPSASALPKRFQVVSAAVTSATSRVRVEIYR